MKTWQKVCLRIGKIDIDNDENEVELSNISNENNENNEFVPIEKKRLIVLNYSGDRYRHRINLLLSSEMLLLLLFFSFSQPM